LNDYGIWIFNAANRLLFRFFASFYAQLFLVENRIKKYHNSMGWVFLILKRLFFFEIEYIYEL